MMATSGKPVLMALLALVILCAAPVAARAADYEDLLRQADQVRTTDPERFNRLLDELGRGASAATPAQRQYYRLLRAYRLILTGNYRNSIDELEDLLAEAPEPELQFRAIGLLATNYAATRQFTEGFSALEQMLGLGEKITNKDVWQRGLISAAVLYNQAGQHELGRHYAEVILANPASARNRCFANHLRIESLLMARQLPPDDAPIEAAIRQCDDEKEAVMSGFLRGFLAQKWHSEGKTAQAIAMLSENMDALLATRYPRVIGEIQSLLAQYELELGHVDRAEAAAKLAVQNSTGSDYPLPIVEAYNTLYRVAVLREDAEAALDYYRRYAEADKGYLNDVQARELAYQLARHETLQKNQQIALLDRRNQVLQLQQRVDKQAQQNTQLLAAFLALLVATIGYWAWKMKRVQGSFRRLAETDMLTGISNRHHFTRKAEEALEYCRRNIEDVGLILFDLDHFKSINDRFGHIVGDFVLMQVAEVCKASCRKNDRFARIGGEEFAILLVGCDMEATARMAQVCCRQIAAIDTSPCGHEFPVTASFGVTTASLSGYELSRMMSHADQMLYRSKHEGRNQVQIAGFEAPLRRAPDEQDLFTTVA